MSPRRTSIEGITEAQVAVRAYERWMGRGCPISDGLDDWTAARCELEAELGKPASRTAARAAQAKAKAPPKAKAVATPASMH